MNREIRKAAHLHENVPPDWYYSSIKENLLQRYWHERRFREVGKLVEPTGGVILDIGCADGVFTEVILRTSNAKKVIGIDVLGKSINWARVHWRKEKRLEFKVADAQSLPFEDGTFDAIFALEVLEHVYRPKKALKEIKRVLKKGGYAIFLVPTDSLLFKTGWDLVWTKTRGKVWKETHIQTYRNDYLVRLAKKTGFTIELNKKFLIGMLQLVKVRKK